METVVRDYRDLEVWREAMELAVLAYGATLRFPRSLSFGLADQIRRSAVSVPSNIAEGNARRFRAEFLQGLGIARGSLAELETQLLIAAKPGGVSKAEWCTFEASVRRVGWLLQSLMNSLRVPH